METCKEGGVEGDVEKTVSKQGALDGEFQSVLRVKMEDILGWVSRHWVKNALSEGSGRGVGRAVVGEGGKDTEVHC
jgi:hypothetical protein